MQNVSLPPLRSYDERNRFARGSSDVHNSQYESVSCPHCRTQCKAAGMVKNSWYAICQCGTYIQMGTGEDEYSD